MFGGQEGRRGTPSPRTKLNRSRSSLPSTSTSSRSPLSSTAKAQELGSTRKFPRVEIRVTFGGEEKFSRPRRFNPALLAADSDEQAR